MERASHSAATAGTAQEDGDAQSLLLGLPAWAFALVGLLLGLLVTGAVVLLERSNLRGEARIRDAQVARRSLAQVERQFETSSLLLRALQSAFMVDDDIGQARFATVHANLHASEVLPSLVAMVFASREAPAAPGGRPAYRYRDVVPLAGNRSLLGFDMAAQDANLRALLRARDIDRPVMTAAFPLRQPVSDPRDALGVVVRLPVYSAGPVPADVASRREREIGAVGLSMRVRPLLRTALPTEALQRFRVRVSDVTGGADTVLLDSGGDVLAGAPRYGGEVAFGERRWKIVLEPREAGYDATLLWLMGGAGGIASLLLAMLLWSVATTRRRAVTLGQRLSDRYRESEERFRTLNDLLPALVLMAHAEDGRVVYANEAAAARLGAQIAQDTPLASLFEDEGLRRRLTEAGPASWSNVEAALRTLGGDRFWASTSITRVQLGGAERLLMVASDISEQRQLTEMLSYQATHDALTGLCNRREFERHVRRELQAVARGGASAALLYIDLDQFKLINDTSGHLAGDQLLAQLALAMAEHLRGDDVLARLGGDEFGVLAHEVSREAAQGLAERMRTRIEGLIYVWEQRSYTISASIGVVMIDRAGMTLDDVLAHADAACYMAKDHGRNRIHFYSAQDDETLRRRGEMEWANRLRWVIDEGRLLLDYQEVLPLQGQPADDPHIELLIRLRDEDGRIVAPGAFLPAAERYGMVPLLDRWVIGEAIAHFDRLHASGRAPGRCALNLSASTLEDEGLVDYVFELIDRHGVAPSRLCFEITETEAMRNIGRAVRVMERLRGVGCQVALDDFGAGMSSFGYLKNLPIDVIKIDGSFIRELATDPMSRSIVDAITEIGHQRGLDVVAEWVADEGTVDLLRSLGVDYGQGFALHRPQRVLYQQD